MDLVTVIVPIYNVEKYLARCVESILKQSYQNLEIILINDGSTDCSGDICDVFQTIKTFQNLEKGKYKVAVKSKFAGPYLPNVLGVGIVVEKQK